MIASLQSIIMYEYLPAFLGIPVEEYEGYKADIHPGISHVFQSAAFRYCVLVIQSYSTISYVKLHHNFCQGFSFNFYNSSSDVTL